MIKEVVSMRMPDNKAHEVAQEWAEEAGKYFNISGSASSAFYHENAASNESYHRKRKRIESSFPMLYKIGREIMHFIRYVHYPILSQDLSAPLSVYILMEVSEIPACAGVNCLPVFTDVWENSVRYVVKSTKKMKLFYVTSRAVYDLVKAKAPRSNVRYMPLSVADKYYSPDFGKYRRKTIDVIQFGRKDPLLHEYMLRYASEHKDIDYVYAPGNRNDSYISTLRGDIGPVDGRDSFIKILSGAKISLVSAPGMIKEITPHKFGICFVTPRFYESAVLGCSLIGRYPDNQEFRELKMSRYCPNITSYEQFVRETERALAMTPEELFAQNRDFILNSLTSRRAEQIRHDLEELTCQKS